MIAKHPGLKLAGLIVILLLGGLAQTQFLASSSDGYLLLGAAGVIALVVIAPRPAARIAEAPTLDWARGLRRWLGLIALVLGVVIVANSATIFHEQLLISANPSDYPWILYGIGLGLALLGGLMIVGIGRLPRLDVTLWIVIALLALAVFVRVYQIDQYPFGVWYDEAIYGLHVRHWLSDPNFRPIFVDNITFPHLLADVISLQIFGGSNVAGLRLISALLGSAGVICAYLVGRELRGAWFGVLMAFLLAALRWSIDFSRIGMIGAELVTLVLLTIFTMLRLIRYGRLRDALWFGAALALGFYGYSPYQLQVIALAIFFLFAYPFLRRDKRRTLILGVTAVLAALIVLTPLLVFIADRSSVYFNRVNTVSIFNEERGPDETLEGDLLQSTLRHLQMFQLSGDRNGRHNLPGAPMLDPVTGSLMVIGLFMALRERRREQLLFLLSLVLALLSAILSVSFEAPQSLRSIGAICAVIYFAALGLEGLFRLAVEGLQQRKAAYWLASAGALGSLGVMAAWNFNIYFNLQRSNLAVWSAYSTVESLTGRSYASYPSNTQFFVSPLIGNSVSVQFLAPMELDRSNQLVMPDPFPLRIPANSPAVMMLVPFEKYYLDYLHQLYPNALFKPIRPVDYGINDSPEDVFFTVIELTADDVGAIQGLRNGQGILYAPQYDRYTFSFAPGVHLEIDHQAVTSGTPIQLVEGNHRIAVTPADATLTWQYSQLATPAPVPPQDFYHDPVTPNGLVASFYDSPDWQGDPVSKQISPLVYWLIQTLPMNRPYSVRYDGYVYAPKTGDYRFNLNAIDTAALDLDGKNLIITGTPNTDALGYIRLEQGWHSIEVRHQDLTFSSRIFLLWSLPGGPDNLIIARDYFCPARDLCATPNAPDQ